MHWARCRRAWTAMPERPAQAHIGARPCRAQGKLVASPTRACSSPDRACGSGPQGRGFDSLQAHQPRLTRSCIAPLLVSLYRLYQLLTDCSRRPRFSRRLPALRRSPGPCSERDPALRLGSAPRSVAARNHPASRSRGSRRPASPAGAWSGIGEPPPRRTDPWPPRGQQGGRDESAARGQHGEADRPKAMRFRWSWRSRDA